jgi:hypothetical protein
MLVANASVGRDGAASRFNRCGVHRLNLGKNRGWRMLASGQYCAVADKLDCEIDLDRPSRLRMQYAFLFF